MLTTEDAIKIKDLDSIASHHREEWVKSAVNSNIIELNVRTIYDSRELDKIINRNNKRRWKHSDELVPAWCVSGIDPLTDEPTLQGVQVKPDKPPVNADGKIQKYLGAKDFEASPLFLDTGTPWFWKDTIDNVSTPVLITEGAKKAASALTLGIPAISIPGVATCRKKGRLHQNLELFAKPGRTFYLGFDNDLLIKEQVQKALIGLGRELAACGAKVMVLRLPEGEAKGIDDYIALHGEEAFRELFINPSTFEEWLDEIKNQEVETEEYQPKSRLARYDNIIKNNWGQYLRYNTLKKRVELHGRDLKADKVRLYAARQFDIDISTNDVLSIVRDLAELESYSPVLEYLDECAAKFPDTDPSFLDGLAKQYFGSDNPTHAIYFKKFLVSAVARARRPGCKVDTVFMLVSPKQGVYKSTFFRLLFGEGFFSDQLGGDISDKDEKMKMHRFWCLEWSEFEAVYKRKDIATLKNFITSVEDTFRAPYDREPETYLRPCVFVGTSNEQEILHDPTGDRRFWIVPVTVDKIPVRQVLKDRDKIWASANALYQSGFQWRLTDEEELARAELNKAYQGTDYWDEIIEQLFLDSQPTNWISTESIIKRLGFENARQLDAGSQARLTKTMTRLGFEKKILRINGSQKRGWQKVARDSTTFDKNIDSGVTVSQPMHNETFSRDTTVTPPVTGVTQPEINTVTPVTPPVTEVSQPKFLQNKECDTVTPETASNPKIIKTDEAIASPNAQHPTPNDQGVNEEGAIDPKNPANEAGKKEFRVGDSVIVFDSKNIDLIGTVQTIKHLNERSIIFESGGFVYSSDDIRRYSSNGNQGGYQVGATVYRNISGSSDTGRLLSIEGDEVYVAWFLKSGYVQRVKHNLSSISIAPPEVGGDEVTPANSPAVTGNVQNQSDDAGEWEQLTDDNFAEGHIVRVHAKSHPYHGRQTKLVKIALLDKEVTTSDLDTLPIAILEVQKHQTESQTEPQIKLGSNGLPLPQPIDFNFVTPIGECVARVEFIDSLKAGGYKYKIEIFKADKKIGALKQSTIASMKKDKTVKELKEKSFAILQPVINKLITKNTYTFKVQQLGDNGYFWVRGCQLNSVANGTTTQVYVFTTPDGKTITVAGLNEFEKE